MFFFFHVLTSADSFNIDITGLTDLKDILGFMKLRLCNVGHTVGRGKEIYLYFFRYLL